MVIIALSNILVQFPCTIFGWHTTLGAFSYPLVFIVTDLTVRLAGPQTARNVVFKAMLPGLLISYILSNGFAQGFGFSNLLALNVMALRIAFASFLAYILGQLLDILVFQRLRKNYRWWLAPGASSIMGNIFDTYCFFSVAFYQSSDWFMRTHWIEIATVDLAFKILISLLSFVPIYGMLLKIFASKEPTLLLSH